MSTSVFKGSIKTGTISARYRAAMTNPDPDLLVISYAPDGGPSVSFQDAAAPGGSAVVQIDAPARGVLEVLVVTGISTEHGRLTTACDGTTEDDEEIAGSTRWIYAVVP